MHATLFPISVKFVSTNDAGVFEGLASTFGGEPDSYGDVVVPGAFSQSLSEHKKANTRPAMLFSHAQDQPIGSWLQLEESNEGLHVRGKLTLGVAKAREAHALMKDGALAMSIGYGIKPNGAYASNGVRYLKALDLHEISAVAMPANRNARITSVKSYSSITEFEKSVRDELGLSARQAKRLLSGGWSAMVRDEPAESTEDELKAVAAQLEAITQKLRSRK